MKIRNLDLFISVIFMLGSIFTTKINAQCTPTITHTGPDTIVVDANCSGTLSWGTANVNVAGVGCSLAGSPIFVSALAGATSYNLNDVVPNGSDIVVKYSANINDGTNTTTVMLTFTLYVRDKTAPVLSGIPTNVTVATCSVPVTIPNVNDNCTAGIAPTYMDAGTISTCGGGTITRTWLATDAAGNTGVLTQNIFVNPDNVPPVVTTAAADLLVNCNPATTGTAINTWLANHGGAMATDCNSFSWTYSPVTPAPTSGCMGNAGSVEVTFSIKDACNNITTTKAKIVSTDQFAPVITQVALNKIVDCGNVITALPDWIDNSAGATASDACAGSALTVKYYVNNVLATKSQLQSYFADSLALPCQSSVNIDGSIYNKVKGKMKVSFVFVDPCNNASAPTAATFVATDNSEPVFTTLATDKTVQCDTVPNIAAAFTAWYNTRGGAVATDNCGTPTYTSIPTLAHCLDSLTLSQTNSCGNTGKVKVAFYATDACGNSSTIPSRATFFVADNTAPVFTTVPSSITVNCLGQGNGNIAQLQNFINTHANAVATDNCSNPVTWSFTFQDKLNNTGSNTYPIIPNSGAGFPPCAWFVDVIFKAKDECGNETSAPARFSIEDKSPPVFGNLKPDITVDCSTIPPQFSDFPSANDNCGFAIVNFASLISNQNSNCSGTYQIKKTWTATDQCGNMTAYTRTITVMDTQKPVISGVPANVTLSCDAVPPIPKVIITDGCDPKPDSIFSEISTKGTNPKLCNFYNYTLTRTWTAMDKCGNSTSASYIIKVKDDTAPTFTAPANVTVECFEATNSLLTGRPTNIVDNCDNFAKIDSSDIVSAGSCAGNNTITRTWKISDACNNILSKNQTIVTKDTRKPNLVGVPLDMTLECGTPLPIVPTVTVKDSCDNSITAVFVGTNLPSTCIGNFKVKREWKATDNCGNVSSKTQTITYLDTQKPKIEVCPIDITVNNTVGLCEATATLKAPVVTDNCGNTSSSYFQNQSAVITSNAPGDANVIVNPINLNFTVPLNATTVANNVTFDIDFKNADAEAPTEYFDIISENNTNLGKTNATLTQCGTITTSVSLTAAQVNAWGQDGIISITLSPNIPSANPPSYGVNDICPNAVVSALLTFATNSNTNLSYEYSIDNGAKTPVAPIANANETLEVGKHLVKYFVKDCNSNVDSCQYNITVLDKEAPTMIAPANQNYVISGTNCTVMQTIPAPTGMNDNCGFGTGYSQKQPEAIGDSLLTFSQNPNLSAYFADDKVLVFTGVASNAIGADPVLRIELQADSESAGEYFTFLGEDNIPLGNTNHSGSCTAKGVTKLTIPLSKFNTWASDGLIVITALSNISFPVSQAGTNPGINPCNNSVLANGQNDGESYLVSTLSYNKANPDFSTSGATTTAPTPLFQSGVIPQVTFNIGTTVVKYELSDAAGNKKVVNYNVVVSDNTPPVAKCQNVVVEITPTSSGPATINATQINNGSTDNCGIASITVFPNTFVCSDVGSTKNVVLTVKDLAGNTSTCSATVVIGVEKPKPTYSLGICGNDTLKLFANAPVVSGNIYLYSWSGPNNFSSTLKNPFIPNVSSINGGTYSVYIYSSVTGSCYSAGESFEVPIDNQPNTPTITSPNVKPCTNGELTLNTAAYTGKKVKYYWYKGIAPNGTIVDSTTVPSFSINNPITGNVKYYVVVKVDGCISNPSSSISISPANPPIAAFTNPVVIEVCEGADVTLGTSTIGLGYKYQWTGPDNFTATTQYPPVLTNAKPTKSGVYSLIISSPEGCESAPISTSVNVKAKPKTPVLVANGLDCEGSNLNLITNITGASSYHWINPIFNEQVTTTNTLTLSNLNKTNMKGNWKLYVMNNGCKSDESNSIDLKIHSRPTITADFQLPVCEGSTMQLNAIGSNSASYSWSGPNGFVSNAQNPNAPAVQGTYIAVVIDPNGCTNFDDVVVNPKPKPEIKTVVSNAQPCVTGTADIKLTPTVFPFDSTYAYQWTGATVSSNNKILTLPNATATANGTYTLQVISKEGCKSTPFSYVVKVYNTPSTPVLKGSLTQNFCEGDNILLEIENSSDYTGASVTYKWDTPAGVFTTTIPTLSIPMAHSVNSGDYSLKVIINGCESLVSGTKKIVVNTIPGKPAAAVNSPLCTGETLQTSTTFINSATYEWLGPDNFTSSISNPSKPNVTKDAQGFYKVKVIVNGCQSVFSNPVYLTVNEVPKNIAVIKNTGAVCLDSKNISLTLSVEPNTAIQGASYTWFSTKTNTQLNTPNPSLNYTITDFTTYKEGLNDFHVITSISGCATKASVPTSVLFNKIPGDNAFAGADMQVCDAQSVSLAAQKPSIGTGAWTQVQGSSITIADSTLANTKINGLVPGQNYTLQWKLSNGACKDYSFDEVKINVNDTSIKADAGDSIQLCSKILVNLNGNILSSGTSGAWTQSLSQQNLGVVIANPMNPKSLVTGLAAGNTYIFRWTLSNTACKDYSFDEVYVTVESPQGTAYAGADFKACGNAAINLNATPSVGTIGKWTSLSTAKVISPSLPNTAVSNLTAGKNLFVWAISTKTCGTYSKDTVAISYEPAVTAVADNISVPYAGSTTFDPTQNDVIPTGANYTLKITVQPKHGTVKITTDRKIEYKANNAFAGTDEIEYQICNTTCPDVCSTAKVAIRVEGGTDCTVPTIITPNDDQINDRWEIPCLVGTDFPNSTVIIFNQWGDEVFRANNYKNDWMGTYNGQPLPTGTYFFIVQFSAQDIRKGFLIIER
jgi:gliding motility-associated-like protein